MSKIYAHKPYGDPGAAQRLCELQDGEWVVYEADGSGVLVGEVCRMDHTISETMVYPDKPQLAVERGDFGMPTIGGGRILNIENCLPDFTVDFTVTLRADGMDVDFSGGKGYRVPATTPEAWLIMQLVPEILGEFLNKNTQYARAQSGHDLGPKGIIPDINRKTSALISRVWDDQVVQSGQDPTEEIIDDLIGHLLLMRAKINGAMS